GARGGPGGRPGGGPRRARCRARGTGGSRARRSRRGSRRGPSRFDGWSWAPARDAGGHHLVPLDLQATPPSGERLDAVARLLHDTRPVRRVGALRPGRDPTTTWITGAP